MRLVNQPHLSLFSSARITVNVCIGITELHLPLSSSLDKLETIKRHGVLAFLRGSDQCHEEGETPGATKLFSFSQKSNLFKCWIVLFKTYFAFNLHVFKRAIGKLDRHVF